MGNGGSQQKLFWACFIALIATAFGFIIRAMIIDDWAKEFGLSETQKGDLFGVGLWPFAISIVLFSLVIDRIGYGRAMVFAFICHVLSAIITIGVAGQADWWIATLKLDPNSKAAFGYWSLYVGTFIVALGNGTVEAVINPVVATIFSKEKTKWLNILHAGWPGGLVLGGLIVIGMGYLSGLLAGGNPPAAALVGDWRLKVALILLPTLTYGAMMLTCKFPQNERVKAGVGYRDMLKEAGALGALVVTTLIVLELGRVAESFIDQFAGKPLSELNIAGLNGPIFMLVVKAAAILLVTGAYFAYVRDLGRWMFVFLLLVMIPLATTELGTDSWITDLMAPLMGKNGAWVLVYTSFIMMVLRFFAGPIVHSLSPLGLLCASSLVAALGLVALSFSHAEYVPLAYAPVLIFLAATLYGFGKTFFWPTMLGVVSEQFPKGGALTLNMMGGVGMLGVGVLGAQFLGYIQDTRIDAQLAVANKEAHARVIDPKEKEWVLGWALGKYRALDGDKVKAEPEEVQKTIDGVKGSVKQNALRTVAIFPVVMLACYLLLTLYFLSRGGYQAEVLAGHKADDDKFTGGVEAAVE